LLEDKNLSENITLSADVQQLITAGQAWHYFIIPKNAYDGVLEVYIDEQNANDQVKDELEVLLNKKIKFEKIDSDVLRKTLGKYYRKTENGTDKKTSATHITNYQAEDFLNKLIREAKEINSSDIHIEIYEERCRIRIRIDGKLIERYVISRMEYPALINKIKIKANLDIAEKRLPQDGRIIIKDGEQDFDIRVSVLPTLYGEKIVLRLLSKDATNIDIYELGFSERQLSDYLEGIKRTQGIILISGPTGSGKTTTLYATLKILNKEHTNILTIEDPIEYTLTGINQVQLKESIGLTFASALRTFLRQDPDIIMLGEIRDSETANMAIRAALTGHLVLSTIHTNSAWGTISRLADMGVPSFLLANTLNLTIAQRLVRLLCNHCKKEAAFDMKMLPRNYKVSNIQHMHYVAVGCEECFYTGYKGRKAVYDVIPIDAEFSDYIKNMKFDISDIIAAKNITTLADNAFALFAKGDTTLDEIYSILLNY
jgi:type IV pilus assembly protein PilB